MLTSQTINQNHQEYLESFTNAGVFNVAILQEESDDNFFLAYHIPFPKTNSPIIIIKNPTDWQSAFPSKVDNLHGHLINLVAIDKPPGAILNNHDVSGVDRMLFETILKHWNATLNVKPINYLSSHTNATVLDNLLINRYPFFSGIQGFEMVQSNDQDQVRIMVRHNRAFLSPELIKSFLCRPFVVIQLIIFGLYFALHYFLFHRPTDLPCHSCCALLPIALGQFVHIRTPTRKERIFFAGGLGFAFFAVALFEGEFTSNFVTNQFEPKIKTVNELVKRDFNIYSNRFTTKLLLEDHFNLSKNFLGRIKIIDEWPWTLSQSKKEYAFIISLVNNEFFFESALNMDSYGFKKFYLMDHVITTTPLVFLFIHHSPYKHNFQIVHNRLNEAGLRQYWRTKTLRKDVWNIWRNFKVFSKQEDIQIFTYANISLFGFYFLCSGWTLSFICLLVEIKWHSSLCWGCRKVTTKVCRVMIVKRKPRNLMRKYNNRTSLGANKRT